MCGGGGGSECVCGGVLVQAYLACVCLRVLGLCAYVTVYSGPNV